MTEKKKKLKPETTIRTLQQQAWKRAMEGNKPNAGTPHDWQDYEKAKNEKK